MFFTSKMFKLKKNYEVDRRIPKFDYISYSPAETSATNTPNSQIYINVPKEDSVNSLLKSYLDLYFEVIKIADNSRYANGNDIRLVNLCLIALFSNFILRTSSGKHSEDISHAHIVPFLFKKLTSIKNRDDFFIGFDHSRSRRRDQLARNKKRR